MIKVENLKKEYKLYNSSRDRLKEIFGLNKGSHYTKYMALDNISFNVEKGETVGIIGTNGSGKSTLLKIITGVLSPTEGVVEVNGKISALLELGAGFNQEYSGIQNIYLNGRMMGFTKNEMDKKVNEIIEFAEIGEFINQPVKTYSSGMFARLAFAVAINVEPDILIVDEALSVGDLFFQNKCFRKFDELKEKGITILFVSHDISSVRQMCSRVLWIEKGQQVVFADSDTVCNNYMDKKRLKMNEESLKSEIVKEETEGEYIQIQNCDRRLTFPMITYRENNITNDNVCIRSCFVTNKNDNITKSMIVENKYKTHIVIEFFEDMEELIVGFIFNNNKGLPLFDINNYINEKHLIRGKKGEIIEVIFEYDLPRLMRGNYTISAAIAQGTQETHIMLSWLHGVDEVEIVNEYYNSSYIEIPALITLSRLHGEKITFE